MLSSVPGHQLADVCASLVKASYAEKLQMLETLDLTERFKKILPLIMRQAEGDTHFKFSTWCIINKNVFLGLQMLQEEKKPMPHLPGPITR